MQLEERLEFAMKGEVTFHYYGYGKDFTVSNAIQAPAKEIVAKSLIFNAIGQIDTIEVYNLGVLVCSRPIITRSILSATMVEFDALFDAASFNSAIDEVRLKASLVGYFSIVTGLAANKTSIQSILVSWTIQIV